MILNTIFQHLNATVLINSSKNFNRALKHFMKTIMFKVFRQQAQSNFGFLEKTNMHAIQSWMLIKTDQRKP